MCFILDAEMIIQTHGGCPEAEWECACRSVATAKYSFGDDSSKLGGDDWCFGRSAKKMHLVCGV